MVRAMRENHSARGIASVGVVSIRGERWAWIGFLIVAVAGRMATLGYEAFWHDEIFTRYLVSGTWGEMHAIMAGDVHPPVYFWLLWGWARVFGTSPEALRAFSGLTAGAAVAALGCWLRWRVSPRAGWIGAAALLFHPMLVAQSIFARMYALETLLTVGFLAAAGELLRAEKRRVWPSAWGLGIAAGLLVGVQYFAVFFVLPAVAALVGLLGWAAWKGEVWPGVRPGRRGGPLLVAFAVCGLMALATLGRAAWVHAELHSEPIWIEQVWGERFNARLAARVLFGVLGVRTQEGFAVLPLAGLALTPLLAGWVLAAAARRGIDPDHRRLGALMGLILIGMAAAALAVMAVRPIMQGRYLTPAAVVLVAALALAAEAARGQKRWSAPVAVHLALLMATTTGYLYGRRIIERWDVVSPEIRDLLRPGDVLALYPPVLWVNFDFYVPDLAATGAERLEYPYRGTAEDVAAVSARVAGALRGGRRAICVLHHPHLWDADRRFRGMLEREGKITEERVLPGRNWWLIVAEPAGGDVEGAK
jgi:uncharacterized membrane protein